MSYVHDLLSSLELKFETTVFLGITRDFRVFHNNFALPILSESFSSKKACFFAAINFGASYLAFLYNYLSIWSLEYLSIKPVFSIPVDSFSLTGCNIVNDSLVFQRSLNTLD